MPTRNMSSLNGYYCILYLILFEFTLEKYVSDKQPTQRKLMTGSFMKTDY